MNCSMPSHRHPLFASLVHTLLTFLLLGVLGIGGLSCGYIGAGMSALTGSSAGGGSSASDRSQPLVPAISNQGGGLFRPFVNLWSGNLVILYPLLSVAAIGPEWDLNLYYNSVLAGENTELGPGWRHSYEIQLLLGDPEPNSMTVRWGDGRRDVFVSDGSGWSGPAALHGRRITQVGNGYRLRTKHGFAYLFDLAGQLIQLQDRNGNAMSLAYDKSGHLISVTEASGRLCQFSYDKQGRLTSLSGLGLPTLATFQYDGSLLSQVRDPLGLATMFSYNGQLLSAVTDPEGDGIAVQYQQGLPVVTQVQTTDNAERRFSYNQSNLETSVTDVLAQGQQSVARYRFDQTGRCLEVTDGPLGTTHNSYDNANNLVSHTDADGHTTLWTYSLEGDLLSERDPINQLVSMTYDGTYHLLVTVTDQAGNTWSGQRNGSGNLITWTDPLGNQDAWAYNAQGLLVSHTDRRGNTTTYAYDAHGNLIAVTDPAGFTSSATYNPRGMPLSITDQENNITIISLTARDEVASVTLADGATYTLSWTASRMLSSVQGPRGEMVSWQFNDRKQRVGRTDALGFTFSLVRDGAGGVIRAVNALGDPTHFDRDLAGRLIAIRDPDGGVVSFGHGCCDILTRTDALGTMNYQYSAKHELVAAIAANESFQVNYARDSRGLLVEASQFAPPNPAIDYDFAYDAAGRRVSVTAAHLGSRITDFILDPEGNPIQAQVNPNPSPLSYSYDNRNLPVSVSAGGPPLTANISYSPRRQVTLISYSNGVVASYGYSAIGQLNTVHYQGPGFVADYNVGYDASGNRVQVSSIFPPPLGSRNLHVDYDLRQLPMSVSEIPGGLTNIIYNSLGDRVHLDGPNGSVKYAHTPAQRMISGGSTTLQWNQAGGCTLVARPGTSLGFLYRADGALRTIVQNGQPWQFLIGPLGEVVRVVLPSGTSRWFALDIADRGLLRREILPGPGVQPTDRYVYPIFDDDTNAYQLGPNAGGIAVAPLPVWSAEAPIMWLKSPALPLNQRATMIDPWGSITIVADGAGNLFHARVYGLFGDIRAQTNSQHVGQGFLSMDIAENLSDPYLLGLSGNAATSVQDPMRAGYAGVRPFLTETGGFLYDARMGSNGLFSPPGTEWGSLQEGAAAGWALPCLWCRFADYLLEQLDSDSPDARESAGNDLKWLIERWSMTNWGFKDIGSVDWEAYWYLVDKLYEARKSGAPEVRGSLKRIMDACGVNPHKDLAGQPRVY